jgi:restriction endonuclease S subunit
MFGDPVRNEKGWEVKKMGEYLKSIENGWSPKCQNKNVTNSTDIAILKLGSISKRIFIKEQNKAVFEGQILKKIVTPNLHDILFSRKNTRELVGATAMVFDTHENLLLPDTIFKLNFKDTVSPFYIWYLFNSQTFKSKIQNLATGAAASMINISKSKLKTLRVPMPSIKIQKEFGRRVQEIRMQKIYSKKSFYKSEQLFQSLLQKAFKGELLK